MLKSSALSKYTSTNILHVHTVRKWCVASVAAYADALLNPIAYISKLEKHAHQLEILTEDFDSDVSIWSY